MGQFEEQGYTKISLEQSYEKNNSSVISKEGFEKV